MGTFYSRPSSLAIENLTTVYVLKWVVFVPPEKVVGSHYDALCHSSTVEKIDSDKKGLHFS